MDFCEFNSASGMDHARGIVYLILLVEYLILIFLLIYLFYRSYKSVFLDLSEYRLYLIFIILSSLAKVSMFIDFCAFSSKYYKIFLIAYELPLNSSLTLIIYLWYAIFRRVMQLDADFKINQIDNQERKKKELVLIVIFNIIMYLFLILFSIFILIDEEKYDFELVARIFKGALELVMAIGLILSALKLALTIKKLMQFIPNSLIVWLTIGALSSFIKSLEQILFYYLEYSNQDAYWIYILLLILYNLDDLLPTIVFLTSFKVYSKFISKNRESFESFDDNFVQRLNSLIEETS